MSFVQVLRNGVIGMWLFAHYCNLRSLIIKSCPDRQQSIMHLMFSKTTWLAFFIVMFLLLSVLFFCAVYFRWNEQDNPVESNLTFIVFFVSPAGNMWMIWDCLSHDRRWTRKVWLALFVPFVFVWYYFEIYRPRLLRRNRQRL